MTRETVRLTLADVEALTRRVLLASNTCERNAIPVAHSIVAAEAEGILNSGLVRLPGYCAHARIGKVDGHATPTSRALGPAALLVDARTGFAHPAIDLALSELVPMARRTGIASASVTNSYNAGVIGHHVERLAEAGLIGLAFVNSPKVLAPWGGRKPLFGTNPIACAAPRRSGPPIVIDQSSSLVARGEVLLCLERGEPIPDSWGFDTEGKPTTDPKAVLGGGTLAPAGGYKGAMVALMVEVMAAALTGSRFSHEASSFTDKTGGAPRTGQFFIAIDPAFFCGEALPDRVEEVAEAILAQAGTRLPGDRRRVARARAEAEGVQVDRSLHERILGYAEPAPPIAR
ncbi:MAG: Ldh family oxidoreductase [Rhodospirillales bacterium]|nr:Ldh family oxidoreductase [Rhodospirillales bacterium]